MTPIFAWKVSGNRKPLSDGFSKVGVHRIPPFWALSRAATRALPLPGASLCCTQWATFHRTAPVGTAPSLEPGQPSGRQLMRAHLRKQFEEYSVYGFAFRHTTLPLSLWALSYCLQTARRYAPDGIAPSLKRGTLHRRQWTPAYRRSDDEFHTTFCSDFVLSNTKRSEGTCAALLLMSCQVGERRIGRICGIKGKSKKFLDEDVSPYCSRKTRPRFSKWAAAELSSAGDRWGNRVPHTFSLLGAERD
jgi:hypothetical protein